MNFSRNIDFAGVLDALSDAVVATDTSGQIVYVNRAAENFFGWSANDLIGRTLTSLLPTSDLTAAELAGSPLRVVGIRKDGVEIDVEVSLSRLDRDRDRRGDLRLAVLRNLGPRAGRERELSGERAEKDRLAFLAQAGVVLDSSLDYGVTLEHVARLAVPRLADYCLIDIVEADGQMRRVATAHRDPQKEHLLRDTEDRQLSSQAQHPAAMALQTGAPVVQRNVGPDVWRRIARDADHLQIVSALAPHSWMFIPLTARARALGTLALVLSEPGRDFSHDDLILAQELARRAALAIDNARLYTAERTQRERLYALFMQAPAAIAIVRGPQFRYELSNPMNQEFAGGRELVGKTVREALPELDAQGLTALLEQVYRSGEPFVGRAIPVTMHSVTGDMTRYFNGVYQPLRAADGSVEGVMVFAYEVTDQVLARQKVEQAEHLFRTLTEHAPVGIFLTNADGDCEFVNRRWLELAGMTAEEAAGKGWARALHPEDSERVFREWYEAAQEKRKFASRYRFRAPDGRVRWLLGAAVPLTDQSGTVAGYLGTITDVTEQQQAEAERERLLADLQQAVRQRDEFLSIASHELRTPLTTLRIHVELLAEAAQGDRHQSVEWLRGKVEKIDRQVVRLEDLIRTLLDVSRVTQGRLEIRREPMDLSELVREVTVRFADEAEQASCTVRLDAPVAVAGYWDRGRLDQVVTNLLTNAIKYGRGKPIDIEVGSSVHHAYVRVTDHGMGIPPDARDRIFERFERAVSSRNYGGLGLGLWIARQIIETHGGRIIVDDTEGGGATFQVELDTRATD